MSNFLQLLFIGLFEGSLYAMVAASIVLVYKSTHVVSLAHGQLMAYGALAFWFALTVLKLHFIIALLLALICLAAFGWLIERLAMRPLIGQPLFAAFLTTFALFLLGDGIFQLILKGESASFAAYLPGGMTPVLGVSLPTTQLISFGVCLALFLCLAIFFQKTKMGLGMRASRA